MRRAGDVLTGGHATNNRAEILLDQGRLGEAAELFDSALRTYRAAKFPIGEALVTVNLGRLAAEEGRFADAHRPSTTRPRSWRRSAPRASSSRPRRGGPRRSCSRAATPRWPSSAPRRSSRMPARPASSASVRLSSSGCSAVAAVQCAPPHDAPAHFDESLRLARELGADYEIARTIQ